MFALHVSLAMAGVLAAAASVVTLLESVHHQLGNARELDLYGLRLTYPTLNLGAVLLLALAIGGLTVLAVTAWVGSRQRLHHRRFASRLGVAGRFDRDPTVTVIDDPEPLAFCAGFLRPEIYVSRGTLEVLSGEELEAVLAHEHYHRRVRDPLRFAFARVVGRALWFLPALASLDERYRVVAELNADDAAVRASAGDAAPLAAAMLAFESTGPAQGAGISPERVDSLLGEEAGWRFPFSRMSVSLLMLSSIAALMWRAGAVASAHASLNLPLLSARPCMAVLALLMLFVFLVLVPAGRMGSRRAGRLLHVSMST